MQYERQRHQVAELSRRLSQQGYFAATGGNIMLRLDDERVAVTPSATDYQSMTAADVCVLELATLAPVEARRPASVEAGLHAGVLRRRPDLNCSIHTHQPLASACALLGHTPEVPASLQPLLGERIALVGYAPSGTGLLAGRLARAVDADSRCWLMRNHGVLCAGEDSTTALAAIAQLEQLAHRHLSQRIQQRIHRSRHGDQARLHELLLTLLREYSQ